MEENPKEHQRIKEEKQRQEAKECQKAWRRTAKNGDTEAKGVEHLRKTRVINWAKYCEMTNKSKTEKLELSLGMATRSSEILVKEILMECTLYPSEEHKEVIGLKEETQVSFFPEWYCLLKC